MASYERAVRSSWVAPDAPAVERGYRAVYRLIEEAGSPVGVNAAIWRGVEAFLGALRDDAADLPEEQR
jgi:hypothetical protein